MVSKTVAGPWLSHSLGRQSIIGYKRPTVAGPWLSHSLGRQSMIGLRRAERLVELRIRVLPVFLKTVIFIILYYKTTGAVTRLNISRDASHLI